jgi:hypothetical protein
VLGSRENSKAMYKKYVSWTPGLVIQITYIQ